MIMKYLVKVLALNAGKTIYRSGDVVSGSVFGSERLAELLKGGYIETVESVEVETPEPAEPVEPSEPAVTEIQESVPAPAPKPKKAAKKKTEEPAVNLGEVNLGDVNLL